MANLNPSTPLFDIKNFKHGVNYAIEASAGTGKTYSIKEMVGKLLIDYHVGLDQILIVTYTEKAAGELRNRIREKLTEANPALGGKSIKEVLAGAVNCDVDNAAIGTIHSFCKNTIKEFSLSADQPLDLELVGENTLTSFASLYIREGDILNDISSLLSMGFEVSDSDLITTLVKAVDRYYLNGDYNEDDSIISYKPVYDTDPLNTVSVKMHGSADPIQALKDNDPNLYQEYLLLKGSNDPVVQDFVKLFEDFDKFLTGPEGVRSFSITKKNKYPDNIITAYNDLFKIKKDVNEFDIVSYLVDRHIKDFYKAYQEYKEKNRLQTFTDMLRMVREEVLKKDSKLLQCLRKKYVYGIIDEFQDTNQIQFDVFEKVFMCEGHNIIVVGDPKQSIYAYQGADVKVYQHAVDLIAQNGEKLRLGKNYRSTAGVVEFGNALFKEYPFQTAFEDSDYCRIENNEEGRRLIYKGSYAPGIWLNEEPLNGPKYAKFAISLILDCVTRDPATGYTNLQKEFYSRDDGQIHVENVDFGDFVVLAKTRTEMPHIQTALKNAGIPYVRYKDDTLFNSVECSHWITMLEALNVVDFTGYNRGYFRKVLYTKFFNLSLSEISQDIYDEDNTPEFIKLNRWRLLSKDKLWEDLFDTIIIESGLEERLSTLTEFKSLSAFKQIATYAVDYLSENHSLGDLINHLKNIVEFGGSESDDETSAFVARSTDFNCVRIMTMHASKGLQFPVVISVGGLKGPVPSSEVYSCHHKFPNDEIKHVLSLEKLPEVSTEEFEEFYRVYYVAYTRPEYLLIAPRYDEKADKVKRISEKMELFINNNVGKTIDVNNQKVPYYTLLPFVDTPYKDLATQAQDILSDLKITPNPQERLAQETLLKELIKEKKDKVSYRHSYASFAHPSDEKEEIVDDVADIDKDGGSDKQSKVFDKNAKQIIGKYDKDLLPLDIPVGYPKGAGMGDSIHDVFELVDFTNHTYKLDEFIVDKYKARGISFEHKNKDEWMKYTRGMVSSTVAACLPKIIGSNATGDYFTLKDNVPYTNKKAEIEFLQNYPNEILKNYMMGFMDLLFRYDEDIYSILDWKSDTLNDNFLSYSDPQELRKHVDERYSIQRVLYSYSLIKWLKNFYPLSEEEIFNKHFGGIHYVFVRGCNENTSNGVYSQTWESWSDLEKEYKNILTNAVKKE